MIPEVQPVKIHYGNNEATLFDFEFYVESEEHLLVEHTDMTGVKRTLQYGIDYSVEEFGMPDGSKVIFPLEDSEYNVLAWDDKTGQREILVISLDLPFSQEAEFDISGDLNKKNLETALDYEMRCIQILSRKIDRAIKVEEGAEATPEALMNSLYQAQNISEISAKEAKEQAEIATEQAELATEKAEETLKTYSEAMAEIDTLKQDSIDEVNQLVADHTDDLNALDQLIKKDADAIINRVGLNLFDTVVKDHVLTYPDGKGLALQGTWVYKNAIAGERYGYPDFYNKCLEGYTKGGSYKITRLFSQPIMSSNGTMGGSSFAVSSNVTMASGGAVYHAFDQSAATEFHSVSGTTVGYIDIYNPLALNITKIDIINQSDSGSANRASVEGKIYGSNDGKTWQIITTYTNSVQGINAAWAINLSSNTNYYKYHRIQSTKGGTGNFWTIQQITLTATEEIIIAKKSPNGQFFYDIADKTKIDVGLNNHTLYGVDTQNERIYLPHNNRVLIESKKAKDVYDFWYNVYSDGWCEMGKQTVVPNGKTYITISYPKKFIDNTYALTLGCVGTNTNVGEEEYKLTYRDKVGCKLFNNAGGSATYCIDICGYIEQNNASLYKYFCVGNQVQDNSWVDVVTQVKNGAKDIEDKRVQALSDLHNKENAGLSALANASNALRTTQITNCLLEVPQNIKLELNDGTLTLKAGSKVIVPNGFENDGKTPKFDYVTIQSDIGWTSSSTTSYESHLGVNVDDNYFWFNSDSLVVSGNSTTLTTSGANWYDTANNVMKANVNGEWVIRRNSLPIGRITRESGVPTQINQTFNGMGYIGSTIWVDKGVKGLIPNGRNADGSLKNSEFTTSGVKVVTQTSGGLGRPLVLNKNGLTTYYKSIYNEEQNYNLSDVGAIQNVAQVGICDISNGVISNFQPKLPFRAVDYNEFSNTPHIIETYKNGTSWYRVWSDGWIEQGGVTEAGTVTFLKAFSNTNYLVLVNNREENYNANSQYDGLCQPNTLKTTSFNTNGRLTMQWYACGY